MAKDYTSEEIAEFRAKDVRISKSGIVQALIQSGRFDLSDLEAITPITDVAELYLKWIWGGKEEIRKETAKAYVPEQWEDFADLAHTPIPNIGQKALLNVIFMKYRKISNCEVEKLDKVKLLQQIINKFGKYPTKESSIDIVVKEIPIEDIM